MPVHNEDYLEEESRSIEWVKRIVIGLNLCPFANSVVKSGQLLTEVEPSSDSVIVLKKLVDLCDRVRKHSSEATGLLILPVGFEQFDDYLDLVELAGALLADIDLEGVVQLATFHPDYQFSDTPFEDNANFTNRSPYPMLHILQESAVHKVVQQHPDVESIPERNIEKLRSMDAAQLKNVLSDNTGST